MPKKLTPKKTDKKFALLSVSDKTEIAEIAKIIQDLNYEIISTGGTAKVLSNAGIKVTPVEKITGDPECFDGRMKTISFEIEGGLLYDRNKSKHLQDAKLLKIPRIDIVICNLYPFEKTVQKKNVSLDIAIENIDVGGPTMLRSAAKNFRSVLTIVDPKDYENIGTLLTNNKIDFKIRQQLAAKTFSHLSFYDSQIAKFLRNEDYPDEITIPGRKLTDLRYGENPHQTASFYIYPNTNSPLSKIEKITGRDLSLINLTDINAGLESVKQFEEIAAAVIKHSSPCGLALGKTSKEALERAIEADPESAFGGVIVLNNPIDIKAAEIIYNFKKAGRGNFDIIAAPKIDHSALEYLKEIRKSMGIYVFGKIPKKLNDKNNIKWLDGGFIAQDIDLVEKGFSKWKVVTHKKPTKQQLMQMEIAWKFISRIKSNSIIIVDQKLPMTRGIGSGQTSRVRATTIALSQAGKFTEAGVLASDSFFPFDDSIKLAAKHKIGAIIQQGGSINDKVSIDAANKAGIPMVFTGRRAFWH
jgi:phosphoribosylaminoimidazolecarboxamide formyltransferase / IMP cyclohydrolase